MIIARTHVNKGSQKASSQEPNLEWSWAGSILRNPAKANTILSSEMHFYTRSQVFFPSFPLKKKKKSKENEQLSVKTKQHNKSISTMSERSLTMARKIELQILEIS